MTPDKDLRTLDEEERLEKALWQYRYDEAGRYERWLMRHPEVPFLAVYVLTVLALIILQRSAYT